MSMFNWFFIIICYIVYYC